MPEEVKKEDPKKKGIVGKIKEAASDKEEQLDIPEQKLDPTFIASVFTGVLATFGVQAAKKGANGNGNGSSNGGISKADMERLIAAAAQTAPAQTIRIEQAPIQFTTKDSEPPVKPTV
jgi:hypothetical protein